MVQVQEAGGEAEAGTQVHIGRNLRAAVEGIEGSTGLQVVHVRHVGCHGMPGLADGELPVILPDSGESLPQTQGRGARDTGDSTVEISLDLTADLIAIIFITDKVDSEASRKSSETECGLCIEVLAVNDQFIFRNIVEEVFREGYALTCIECKIIAHKAVGLQGNSLLLCEQGRAKGSGCHEN